MDSHGVAHTCIIGTLYGTNNRRYKMKGIKRSRDIYQQVAQRFGLSRENLETLMVINDWWPWTLPRRVTLTIYMLVVHYGRL